MYTNVNKTVFNCNIAAEQSYIQKHVLIQQRTLKVDGTLLYQGKDAISTTAFFLELYRFMGISYLKFFKMDMLSKLLFLASEALLKDSGLASAEINPHVAIVLYNSHSSIDTDKQFQATIPCEAFFPSPSLFIYTLPSIALGEVAIRNKFTGENCTFIAPDFNAERCVNYVNSIINRDEHTHVICGWFDYINEQEVANIYLVSKNQTDKIFNIKNLDLWKS